MLHSTKFLNNGEGADFLAGLGTVGVDKYPDRRIAKIYRGQNWAVY